MDFAAGLANAAIVSSLYWVNKLRFVCDRTMYDVDGTADVIFCTGPVRVKSFVGSSRCRFLARFPVLMPKLYENKLNGIIVMIRCGAIKANKYPKERATYFVVEAIRLSVT